MGAASSIFFGFILNTAVNPPSYFQFFDNIVLLAALYAVTVATAMFIMLVIYHSAHYHRFDVEKFLLVTKGFVLIGIVCVMLGLGLALDSKLPIQSSHGFASLPFILIFLRFLRHSQEISFGGT